MKIACALLMTKATRSALATAAIALVSIAVQTSAAVVVGIDDAGDRIVALDLASADVLPLIEGRGLRASSIRWSPDGSFAYLSAADGVSIYDPARGDVVGRIEIADADRVSFCETTPIALIEHAAGLSVVDTTRHQVVGENPYLSRGRGWVCSSSGRWAAAPEGMVVDLRDPEHPSWLYDCYGEKPPLAGASDRFYFLCSEKIVAVDAAGVRQVGRLDLNGEALAFAKAGDAGLARVVTTSGSATIDLEGLFVVEATATPFDLSRYDAERLEFSRDGEMLFLDDGGNWAAFRSDDLSLVWDLPRHDALPSLFAVTVDGVHPFRNDVWRPGSRLFYRVSTAGLERLDVDQQTATVVLRDYNFSALAAAPSASDRVYALSAGDDLLRGVDVDSGAFDAQAVAALLEGDRLIAASVDRRGRPVVAVARQDDTYAFLLAGLSADATSVVGEIVRVEQRRPDLDYWIQNLQLVAASEGLGLVWDRDGAWFAVVDFVSGEVVGESVVELDVWSNLREAAVIGGKYYLLLDVAEDEGYVHRPYLVEVGPGGEPDVLWRGAAHTVPTALAVPASDDRIYVGVRGAESVLSEVIEIDLSGAVRTATRLGSVVRDLAVDPVEGWLLASLTESPYLVAIDGAAGLLGSIPGAPALSAIEAFPSDSPGDGLQLDPVVLPADEPPPPDVLIFGASPIWRTHELSLVEEGLLRGVELSDGPRTVWPAGDHRVIVETYVDTYDYETGRILHDVDLATGTVLRSVVVSRAEWSDLSLDLDLPFQGFAVAPDGSVAYATRQIRYGEEGRVLVSVVDLDSWKVVHSFTLDAGANASSAQLSPDGRFLHLRGSPHEIVVDTQSSEPFLIQIAASSTRVTNRYLYYLEAGADRIVDGGYPVWRVPLMPDAPPELVQTLSTPPRHVFAGVGSDVVVLEAYGRGGERSLVALDAASGALSFEVGVEPFSAIAAGRDGARLYLGRAGAVSVRDAHSGELLAVVPVRDSAYPLAVGCAGPCSDGAPVEVGTPWSDRGTVTLTPRRSPTVTPTPWPTEPAPPAHHWLEIDPVAGRPGDTVEVEVRFRSTSYDEWRGGFDHELLFPEVVQIGEWVDGVPDCHPSQRWRHETVAYFGWIPGGCFGPSCSGVRAAVAVADRPIDSGDTMYSCRVRISADAEPGDYEISSRNLVVEGWTSPYRPVVHSGVIRVVPPWPEYPGPPASGDQPQPQPHLADVLRVRGSQPYARPGDNLGVGFFVDGATSTLVGRFEALIEIPPDLELAPEAPELPSCGHNLTRAVDVHFEQVELECGTDRCDGLAVSMDLPPFDEYYRGAREVLQEFLERRYPLFECRYDLSDRDLSRDVLLPLRYARLDGVELATVPGVVRVHESTPTATATSTATIPPTATPTPRYEPRPCEVTEPGVSLVCVNDMEADPGGEVTVSIRYRSGGLDQAGLEFVIEAPGQLVFSDIPGEVGIGDRVCRVNPAILREASAFSNPEEGVVKALILSFVDVPPLADDVELITCPAMVPAGVEPGEYAIRLEQPGGSDAKGNPLPVDVRAGLLRVRGTVRPSATATPAATATPTPTLEERTETRREVALANQPASGSCQVTAPADNASAALALVGLALVALLSRRRTSD